jgi:hypothetical protein
MAQKASTSYCNPQKGQKSHAVQQFQAGRIACLKIFVHVVCVHLQTTRTGNMGQPFGTALDYGAGHVDPVKALNPGVGKEHQYTHLHEYMPYTIESTSGCAWPGGQKCQVVQLKTPGVVDFGSCTLFQNPPQLLYCTVKEAYVPHQQQVTRMQCIR